LLENKIAGALSRCSSRHPPGAIALVEAWIVVEVVSAP